MACEFVACPEQYWVGGEALFCLTTRWHKKARKKLTPLIHRFMDS